MPNKCQKPCILILFLIFKILINFLKVLKLGNLYSFMKSSIAQTLPNNSFLSWVNEI